MVSERRLAGAFLRLAAAALAIVCGATAARGDISGFVRVAGSGSPGTPIPGARVHIRADSSVLTVSGADGSFTLAANPSGAVDLAASIPYNRAASTSYLIGGAPASNGDSGVDIRLEMLPAANNPGYTPVTADVCGSCHTPIYPLWSGSNHADAAKNEW